MRATIALAVAVGLAACAGGGSGLGAPPAETAAPSPPPPITYYPLHAGFAAGGAITVGPDHNLWFTEIGPGTNGALGRITTQGSITDYPLPRPAPTFQPPAGETLVGNGIAAGPDGNIWITAEFDDFTSLDEQVVGVILKVTTGGVPLAQYGVQYVPEGIAIGADGNLWLTESSLGYGPLGPASSYGTAVGKISTAGSIIYYVEFQSNAGAQASGIVAGPADAMWFPNTTGKDGIGRITLEGEASVFPLSDVPPPSSGVNDIVVGSDGNLWFTTGSEYEPSPQTSAVGKISAAGLSTLYPTPTALSGADGIAAGPDGNMWFTEHDANAIGVTTVAGKIVEYPLSSAGNAPAGITSGPDGNLWFSAGNSIAKVTLQGASATGLRAIRRASAGR